LKLWDNLQWFDLPAEFNENLPAGSKVIVGGGAHRQTGNLISLPLISSKGK
jgi:hypothetical protein